MERYRKIVKGSFFVLYLILVLSISSLASAEDKISKYVCACGSKCDCGTMADKPGKCVCGKEMERKEFSKCPICGRWLQSKEGETSTLQKTREKEAPSF